MLDLLTPAPVTASTVLDVLTPVDLTAPLNRGLLNWHLVLPHALGGVTWRNLVAPRHATLVGTEPRSATVGWNATRRQGGLGEVRLNGTSGYATVAAAPIYDFANMTFTVSCWVQATTAAHLVARRHSTVAVGGWFLRLDAGGTATARLIASNGTNVAQRSTVVTTLLSGAWAHLVVVFTTSTTVSATNDMTLYVNGQVNQGTRSTAGSVYADAVDVVSFGSVGPFGAGSFLTGAMDDVRISARGLTATEVQQLYQASRTGYRRELRWLSPPQVWVVSVGTVRSLTAALVGSSSTPPVTLALLRRLTASLSATTSTPTALGTLRRALTAHLSGTTTTPAVPMGLRRRLTGSLGATSGTSSATAHLLRLLAAHLVGTSATASVTVGLVHRLTASLSGVSTTPLATAGVVHRLTAHLAASSSTATATVFVAGQRPLVAHLLGQSATPPAVVTLTRRLTGHLAGQSATPGATVQIQHRLTASLHATSVTSAAVATVSHQERSLTAALVGVSMTSVASVLLTPPPVPPTPALQRIEYPLEVHYVRPDGVTVRIVRKRPTPPAVRVSGRLLP
jgi:hypothetical protein